MSKISSSKWFKIIVSVLVATFISAIVCLFAGIIGAVILVDTPDYQVKYLAPVIYFYIIPVGFLIFTIIFSIKIYKDEGNWK